MESSTHVYYSDEMDDRMSNKKPAFVETGLSFNKRFDEIDDDDDGDRSSSGKYYSIKSNNNFSSAIKENVESAATKAGVYPCLSTFGRHKLAASNPRIKTNPTQGLVLNVNNLRMNNSGGMSEVIANSLTNSSSHSVESAASLTRSSNHYNEPDVYFTSSYCRLVSSNNNNGLEKTSSKIFPRTNPMFRNYGGGSSLKLDVDSNNVTTNTNGVKRPNDFIDVCSKL